ncbi:MAG: acyl-CoA dehydratase activase-related protein [Halanaerobiales bacterium]
MRITFPYMGTTVIYAKLFELLGHQVVMPTRPTKKTIDLGVKYSPEFACYPFKVIMGTYFETLEREEVDIIVTSGGHGPCRAGYYGELHQKILSNMGHEVKFIVFDEPSRNYKKFLGYIRELKGNNSWFKVVKIVRTVYKMAKSLDKIEKIINVKRAYVRNKSVINKAWEEIQQNYAGIKSVRDIKQVEKRALGRLEQFNYPERSEKERIRIGIIGEIYVVMEPSVNNNIEELLNGFGAEVERSHYLSHYIDETLLPFAGKEGEEILNKGEKYIEIVIGGHAKQSVGHIIDYKERGFDGVIHLKPFGCLPEIISQSLLDKISDDLDIPILSLSIDEQTAQANMMTRLEAFLDFIKYRKSTRGERKIVNE